MRSLPRRAAILAAAILIAPLLTAAKCEQTGHVDSDRPGNDHQVDPARVRQAVITVPEASGPYDVYVTAHQAGHALGDHTREHSPSAGYMQTVTYTSGDRIEIRINVTGHPADRFTCQIVDGPHRDSHTGTGSVFCSLTTSQ